MSSRGFTFKQFHINHDCCAMKVGTDGILLGAWANIQGAKRILDIGTGSGLIALMLAQRADNAQITGLELDPAAAKQAASNAQSSPWAHQVNVVQGALQQYVASAFDLIVSNPPYFEHGQAFIDAARGQARHRASLSLAALFSHSRRLLTDTGSLILVLPHQALTEALAQAVEQELHLVKKCAVFTKEGKPAGRFLLHFSVVNRALEDDYLVIHRHDGTYSESYVSLVSPFYLKM
ncbi:tRNA1(Val) (adenine(37)-N6)-methyltransferase [Oceanisphaera pacifica]|uniref:tRNA1(Val) (adenine(37)-N6)-methyltransferase n=1 Tax=Oceanisphaera pacifica TaxID=2818389 RepID=A0ABS3NCI4_9GAMM|nr:methyltransferase [Oceanisphaera pacifica]MBO1518187.1 methyltransferase [Oceanisphaera pacifica]